MSRRESWHVGVDIGGTFTDLIAVDSRGRRMTVEKVLTTSDDPSAGFIEGLRLISEKHGFSVADVARLIHGTTLVTNALIERRGARTALLTTSGFRDVLSLGYGDTLELRKEMRYDIYDLNFQFPPTIIPRFLRREVDERVLADGREHRSVDREQVRGVVRELVGAHSVQSIAVCLLHAYANPDHERIVKEVIRQEFPYLDVSVSSEILPQMREYERMVTTSINAYVQPVVRSYMTRLEQGLGSLGFKGDLFIMTSSGGVVGTSAAKLFPVRLLESGPVAGVLASQFLMRSLGLNDAFTFDMGGTTSKGCIISAGSMLMSNEFEAARFHEFKKGSGVPVLIPNVKLIEIGVGGGSIATLDDRGVIQVGPESAGAKPGPACYGLGGTNPTLADAHLVLGYLNPEGLLGGEMKLYSANARNAIERLATSLGVSIERAAWGIYERASEDSAKAFRVHAAERGVDYRKSALVSFGGCGQINAVRVARKMGFKRLVMPLRGGVFSSLGLLVTPVSFDYSRTMRTGLEELKLERYKGIFGELVREGVDILRDAGVRPSRIKVARRLDMRYEGQGYELEVEAGRGRIRRDELDGLKARYEDNYEQTYSIAGISEKVEVVNFKVRVTGPVPRLALPKIATSRTRTKPSAFRRAFFAGRGYIKCPVYLRMEMKAGKTFRGPAILEERESTTVVESGWRGKMDNLGTIMLQSEDE